MQIISISGKAQHGKDTTASYLRDALERRGKKVLITHYGDLVKYVCAAFLGWDGKKDEAGRSLLQRVGTEIVRAVDPNYWVRFVRFMVTTLKDAGAWDYVLIPDCRFPNEVVGTHIRVKRPGFDNGLTEKQAQHPSETALDTWAPDIVINNCGTMEALQCVCEALAEELTSVTREAVGL